MPCLSPSALATAWPEHDASVLGGVVEIDVQVALGLERDVDQGVAGQLLQHVIEEADAGRDVIGAGAVEIDGRLDLRLLGGAIDGCLPLHGELLPCLRAGNQAFISSGAPVAIGGQHYGPLDLHRRSRRHRPMGSIMNDVAPSQVWHGTTILTVRKGGKVVVAGDGQVSLGATVIKANAQ